MTDVEFSRYRVRDGDVLLNEGQSIDLVGRCAMYKEEYPEPCAIQNQLVRFRAREGVSGAFAAQLFRHCQKSGVFTKIALQTTSVAHLGVSRFQKLRLAWPSEAVEQESIAEALSDADALIESLEQLLAKKRQIKQGAMQELLTGKKRLTGFREKWEVRSFGSVLSRVNAKPHQIQTARYQTTGRYPVVDQGKLHVVAHSDNDDKRFRCPEGGVIVFGDHTCIVKFINFDFLIGADGTQVLEPKDGQCARFHALQLQHKGIQPTGYNRHFKFLKEREFVVPRLPEQVAIALVLSDMETEIVALETKLAKSRALKQGMMQQLLTGSIRLV
ncbi:MAG TPA: restriction endonuclease subunit S [Thermoanaerobaculia bacterium]|nr:restriction endonuclease subunit S [Thermoanaerobaculia bacterium]